MNKLLLLLIVLPSFFLSCSSDDNEDDSKIPVAEHEIQGTWINTQNGYLYRFNFTNNKYNFTLMKISDKQIEKLENGSFTINSIEINMVTDKGEVSLYDGSTVYWDNDLKNVLYFWPLGTFQRGE